MTANEPVVYRVYDKADQLIYVGHTRNLDQRLTKHSTGAWWFSLVRRIDVEHHDSVSDARNAEAMAIRTETPLFNLQHSSRPYPQHMALTAEQEAACRSWLARHGGYAYLPKPFQWVFRWPAKAAA